MKKLLFISLLVTSAFCEAQTTRSYVTFWPNGVPGKKTLDTVYTLPYTANKYITGFGTAGSLPDSVWASISATNIGVGIPTYTPSTGVFNFPQSPSRFAITGGGSTTFTASFTPAFTSLTAGTVVYIYFASSPLTNATLNVDGLGAVNMRKFAGSSAINIVSGDIQSGQTVAFVYDGTYWVMVSPLAPAPAYLANSQTFTAANVFSGTFQSTGGFTVGSGAFTNIFSPSSTGGAQSTNAGYLEGSAVGIFARVFLSNNGNGSTITANNDLAGTVIAKTGFVGGANAHALGSNLMVLTPSMTTYSPVENFQTIYGGKRPQAGKRNWGANIDRTRIRAELHISKTDSTLAPGLLLNLISTTQASRPYPVMTTAQRNAVTNGWTASITAAGTGYGNNTNLFVQFTGGSGTGAEGIVTTTTGGGVTSVTVLEYGSGYLASDVLSATIGAGSGFTYTISATTALPAGAGVFCSDCTATDGSTGVLTIYNATTWKNAW